MLAWAKIREKNPWAHTERMTCWAECAGELRTIIDKAIEDSAKGLVPAANKVEAKYRLFLKGTDAKGHDKDGHALQNMFSRHVIRAKAVNDAEQKTSGNGVKRGDAKDQEERELLMELLAMQDQADLYKRTERYKAVVENSARKRHTQRVGATKHWRRRRDSKKGVRGAAAKETRVAKQS
jgi:hypothetical protein